MKQTPTTSLTPGSEKAMLNVILVNVSLKSQKMDVGRDEGKDAVKIRCSSRTI